MMMPWPIYAGLGLRVQSHWLAAAKPKMGRWWMMGKKYESKV
jgi:hypothetical protein